MALGSALLLAGVLGNWRSSSAATHAGANLQSPTIACFPLTKDVLSASPQGEDP